MEVSTQPVNMGRYAKINVLLGKGAYKVVYKGLDLEEGYEVAWNTCQVKRKGVGDQTHIITPHTLTCTCPHTYHLTTHTSHSKRLQKLNSWNSVKKSKS